MKRFTLIGLALMAALVMAAIPASSASAGTPEILPTNAAARSWTGASDGANPQLIGALAVTCTAAPATGTQEPNDVPLGLFHITFEGCTALAGVVKCTGLNELTAGVILALGTWHLWWDREVGTEFKLTVATIFLTEPVHFSCGSAGLAEVKGEVVCLDLEPEVKAKAHLFHCIPLLEGGKPTAKQNEEYCKEDPCTTWTVPLLLTSTNEGTFKESSELALGKWETTEEVFADKL